MARRQTELSLILDANVLIDFCHSDINILAIISSRIGQIYVATPVLDEVRALDEKMCASLKIELLEPEIDHVVLAGEKRGSLSFEDKLCLFLAKDNGLICVTNEKPLRRECQKEKVEYLWGLELLAILVEKGGITQKRAARVALTIHEKNSLFINQRIIGQFLKRIGMQ